MRAPATKDRWRAVWRTGFVDVLDETGPWIVFGLAVAALMATELDLSGLASPNHSAAAVADRSAGLCCAPGNAAGAVLIALVFTRRCAGLFADRSGDERADIRVLTKLHGRRGDQPAVSVVRAGDGRRGQWLLRLALPRVCATGHEHLNVLEHR